ncbi:MAG: hypothetical protein JO316_14755 [Abitibacteriaceae bacterium]|nr:hypothetical protein [Abditibacteriaceae bacterium]
MSTDLMFVLAVAVITWGGVFFYLLRLERLARNLEQQVGDDLTPRPASRHGKGESEDQQ